MTIAVDQAATDSAPADVAAPVAVPVRCTAWRSLANWSLAVALLVALLWMVPAREISASLREVRIAPLIAAGVLALLVHWLQAVRLHRLARPLGLICRFSKVLAIHFASLAYALVLPGGNMAGAAVRLYKFGGRHDLASAGVMLFADRLIGTMMLGVTGLVCFCLMTPGVSGWLVPIFAGIAVACVIALVPVVAGLDRFSSMSRMQQWPLIGRIMKKLIRTKAVPLTAILVSSLLALLIHGLGIATFLMIARSLGIPLDFWEIGLARATMLTAVLLPISVAGLGLREGAAVLVLSRMGEGEGSAFSFSLLVFLVISLLPGLIGAVVELIPARDGRPFVLKPRTVRNQS